MNPAARRPSHRPPRTSPGDDAAEPRLAPCRPRAVEAFSGDVRAEDALEGLTVDDAAWAGLDLHGLTLLDCDVRGADLDGTVLQGARLRDTAVQVAHAPTLDAPDSSWSTATLHNSRAGAAVLHGLESLRGSVVHEAQLQVLAPCSHGTWGSRSADAGAGRGHPLEWGAQARGASSSPGDPSRMRPA